jgi:signal transduction histidine kinase
MNPTVTNNGQRITDHVLYHDPGVSMRVPRWVVGRRHPTVVAIAATFCAAALVLYLQHRAISALQSQTRVILRQISEQTATDIAQEVRRTLDGPVFDTLTAVNHPELRAGRIDLVAKEFEQGLASYPHVDRFFIWNAQTEAAAPGEVLFYGRRERSASALDGAGIDEFSREPELGRELVALARRYASTQHIYIAAEIDDTPHMALVRLFWTDARRLEYFAVLGFLVHPTTLRERLFTTLNTQRLAELLKRRGGDVPLRMRVTDELGVVVYGDPAPQPLAAHVTFPMLFYPVGIEPRMAARLEPISWRIEVSAAAREGVLGDLTESYGPTIFSVALMLVAAGLTLQANRRSAELARMQADFISHVSHQLKTPLSLLSAAMETVTMERVRSPQKLAQYLGIMRAEVSRLSSLVQRILEFARLQQQRGYEFESVDLVPLVRETVEAFESSLSGVRFQFDVEDEGAGVRVSADPAALEQVLANLLDNAVKYSGDSREVTVRVRSSAGEAVIEVVDHGVGIVPADRDRIFEKFYRGSAASSDRQGFGLGLPIVQELVDAHRGRVEVESAPGTGSTFRVVLPAEKPDRAGRAAAHARDEAREPEAIS